MSDEIFTELSKYVNKSILVKLKNHKTITGILINFDPQMNLVLDDVTTHETKAKASKRAVLRGGNIIIVSLNG